ncbi:MAG: polyprenyl synthetase family protein [Deltaproteobacteria bacterium]|nr:MAG: polyprenyl synthetase family protein [Deltaproteobacteria bacterium]
MAVLEAFDLINGELQRVEETLRKNIESQVKIIPEVGDYVLKSGGKRFRPSLALVSARLCGYQGERHINLASAVEFIHTASLLHDDVIDEAELRRGKSSVNSIWGNKNSILIGDYLSSRASSLVAHDGDLRIVKIFSEFISRMAEGELLQHAKRKNINLHEDDYLSIIKKKTATLISVACQVGAILGQSSPEEESALTDFGLDLGMAFQLKDDCLDYTSEKEELGKGIGADLKEGKLTLPLLLVLKKCTAQEKKAIKKIVSASVLTKKELTTVADLIDKYEGIDYTLDRANEYISKAKRHLDIFPDSPEKYALQLMADYVIGRKS